jgi:hypothetical protein
MGLDQETTVYQKANVNPLETENVSHTDVSAGTQLMQSGLPRERFAAKARHSGSGATTAVPDPCNAGTSILERDAYGNQTGRRSPSP